MSYTWWRHQMETFPRYWPFMQGIHRSPVNSPHKGQWRGALMFSLICAWIKGWVNNREAGDLRRHRAHYDVTVVSHRDQPCQSRECNLAARINTASLHKKKHKKGLSDFIMGIKTFLIFSSWPVCTQESCRRLGIKTQNTQAIINCSEGVSKERAFETERSNHGTCPSDTRLLQILLSELILGLRPANERRRYFVTTSLIDWAQS